MFNPISNYSITCRKPDGGFFHYDAPETFTPDYYIQSVVRSHAARVAAENNAPAVLLVNYMNGGYTDVKIWPDGHGWIFGEG